jgi:glyoxylase-like metal-dependent hydrolase (beta-lactamase superfamily II)
MFGVVPRELWQREHPADDQNRIRLNLTCPLIIQGREAILVDTGIGNRLSPVERKIFDHGDGWLLDGLRHAGMEAGDITQVVLSHLHFDHCGGVVRRRPSGVLEPAFPKARILIQQGELDVAQNSGNERLRAAYRHVGECLETIKPKLEGLNGTAVLAPGVSAIVTGGHTADHQVVMVESGRECFMHMADIVPTRSHMRGPWNQAYDLDAIRTMEQKACYLAQAVAGEWWVSFAHDDRMFAARIANDRGKLITRDPLEVAQELNGI